MRVIKFHIFVTIDPNGLGYLLICIYDKLYFMHGHELYGKSQNWGKVNGYGNGKLMKDYRKSVDLQLQFSYCLLCQSCCIEHVTNKCNIKNYFMFVVNFWHFLIFISMPNAMHLTPFNLIVSPSSLCLCHCHCLCPICHPATLPPLNAINAGCGWMANGDLFFIDELSHVCWPKRP